MGWTVSLPGHAMGRWLDKEVVAGVDHGMGRQACPISTPSYTSAGKAILGVRGQYVGMDRGEVAWVVVWMSGLLWHGTWDPIGNVMYVCYNED